MSNVNLNDVTSSIEEFVTDEYMTGYRLSKLTNEILTTFDLKNIPAQMVYNYISKKLIPSVVIDDQRLVTNEAAVKFLTKYVSKKLTN